MISDQGEVVNRYDKRFCSNTEITRFYSPGFEPVVFDIDGYRIDDPRSDVRTVI